MAKRKHAALFEVIHSDKRFSAKAPSRVFATPKWWFKRRDKGEAAPVSAQVVSVREEPVESPAPALDHFGDGTGVSLLPSLGVVVDPDQQTITLKLSYTAAMIAAFTILVLLMMSYLVGRRAAHAPAPLLAEQTTEDLRRQPAHADVMELPDESVNPAELQSPPNVAATEPARPPTFNDPRPSANLVVESEPDKRQMGLNYVIVQSYPDEKDANEARDLLKNHGVKCTVERAPSGWAAPSWFCVIGLNGFVKIRNSPDYDQYVERIKKVSETFGGSSKFKKFQPQPFKWKDVK